MLNKLPYSDHRIIVELDHGCNHEIYEPLARKLGGVWNKTLHGWLFDRELEKKVDEFVKMQNRSIAENQNKEYYTKFGDDPLTHNTPSSSSSSSSTGGLNEAFDLIQELFDRVSDLEKIVEEYGRKLRKN
jgi:hypothetical protein